MPEDIKQRLERLAKDAARLIPDVDVDDGAVKIKDFMVTILAYKREPFTIGPFEQSFFEDMSDDQVRVELEKALQAGARALRQKR